MELVVEDMIGSEGRGGGWDVRMLIRNHPVRIAWPILFIKRRPSFYFGSRLVDTLLYLPVRVWSDHHIK